jgi:hypothetical protein
MNTHKTVEEIADEIQQHFFANGARVSKADFDYVVTTLTTHSAHLVERIEALKKDDVSMEHGDPNSHYYAGERDGFNQALGQAIDIVKENV